MMKIPVLLLAFKITLFTIACAVFYLVSNPYPVCWKHNEAPAELSASEIILGSDGDVCVKTALFENYMCADDPWTNPWWTANLTNPAKFCIARTSTYMAIFIQLCLVCIIQSLHLFFLTKRSFVNYDPLDMIPAFFTIAALSSISIIQAMLSNDWSGLWVYNKYEVPSKPIPHTALKYILIAGILVAAVDWIFYHWLYNAEQDKIEEHAKATNLGSTSDKAHED